MSISEIVNSFNKEFERLNWNIRTESYIDTESNPDRQLEYSITFKAFTAANEKNYLDKLLFIYNSSKRTLEELSPHLQMTLESDVSNGTVSPFFIFPKISLLFHKSGKYTDDDKLIFNQAKEAFNRNCMMIIDQLCVTEKVSSQLIDAAFYIYTKWKELYPRSYKGSGEWKVHKNILSLYLLFFAARFPSTEPSDIMINEVNSIKIPVIESECLLGDSNIHSCSFRYVDVSPLDEEKKQWIDRILAVYTPTKIVQIGRINIIARLHSHIKPNNIIKQSSLSFYYRDIIAEIQDIKQVIVVRKDLNMRKGKLAAQVAHASNAFLMDVISDTSPYNTDNKFLSTHLSRYNLMVSWIDNLYKKVVVSVDTEQQLLDLIEDAKSSKVLVYPIHDAGLTEFHGQKTLTCASFGPATSDKLDEITGNLKLL